MDIDETEGTPPHACYKPFMHISASKPSNNLMIRDQTVTNATSKEILLDQVSEMQSEVKLISKHTTSSLSDRVQECAPCYSETLSLDDQKVRPPPIQNVSLSAEEGRGCPPPSKRQKLNPVEVKEVPIVSGQKCTTKEVEENNNMEGCSEQMESQGSGSRKNECTYLNCKEIGIELEFNPGVEKQVKLDRSALTQGALIEVYQFAKQTDRPLMYAMFDILEHNFDLGFEDEQQERAFTAYVVTFTKRLVAKKRSVGSNQRPLFDKELCSLLQEQRVREVRQAQKEKKKESTMATDSNGESGNESPYVSEIQTLRTVIDKKSNTISELKRKCETLKQQKLQLLDIRKTRGLKLEKANKDIESWMERCNKMKDTVWRNKQSTAKFRKRSFRRDIKIKSLKKQVSELLEEKNEPVQQVAVLKEDLAVLKKDLAVLKEDLAISKTGKRAMYLRSMYYMRLAKKRDVEAERARALDDEMSLLRSEYADLQMQLSEKKQGGVLSFYQKGKYTDELKEVYMDLIVNYGVSCAKLSSVVRLVLEKLAGVKVDRLPQTTSNKGIVFEARHIALQHVKEAISKESDVTLCTDGTTKFGHKYGTAGVILKDGTRMHLGIREQPSGSAMCQFNIVREMVQDIVKSGAIPDDADRLEKEIFVKISNLFGDRAATEKKFNRVFSEYRSEILPQIVEGYDNYSESEKKKLNQVNELFCGLHLIDGLAHQAKTTLNLWEKMIFGDEEVGACSLPDSGNTTSESGSVRLVRTASAAVQNKGCVEQGQPLKFKSFLTAEGKSNYVPLAPFRGHRINILFHNAAGVYFLHSDLVKFTAELKHDNSLLAAVHADLGVPQFKAGCRAMGLVSKFITGPLWRALSLKEHVLKMNNRYQTLVAQLKDLQKDGSRLVRGEVRLYEDIEIHDDTVLEKLIECSDPEFDELTVQIVELLLASLLKVCCKMLADHLEHGMYDQVPVDQLKRMVSVPKTNVNCERDFGIFDRLLRLKSNATSIALEGMIMFKENRTWEWLSSLDAKKKEEVMAVARRSVREQRAVFHERLSKINSVRTLKMKEKKMKRQGIEERKKRKQAEASRKQAGSTKPNIKENKTTKKKQAKECLTEHHELTMKQRMTNALESYGGLWESEEGIDQALAALDEATQYAAVICQLQFRRFTMGMKNEGGILNTSEGGLKLPLHQLVSNLKAAVQNTARFTSSDSYSESNTKVDPSPLVSGLGALAKMREEIVKSAKESQMQTRLTKNGREVLEDDPCAIKRIKLIQQENLSAKGENRFVKKTNQETLGKRAETDPATPSSPCPLKSERGPSPRKVSFFLPSRQGATEVTGVEISPSKGFRPKPQLIAQRSSKSITIPDSADNSDHEKREFFEAAFKLKPDVREERERQMDVVESTTPKVSQPEQLLGKRIKHLIEEKGVKKWFSGTVLATRNENGRKKFQVKYDESQMIWWFDLWRDFQRGQLVLLPIRPMHILGKRVEHMFLNEDGVDTWWSGRVLGSAGNGNTFVVNYDEDATKSEQSLLKDYAENELRILS